jgi:hypothetical protein
MEFSLQKRVCMLGLIEGAVVAVLDYSQHQYYYLIVVVLLLSILQSSSLPLPYLIKA